MKTEVNIKNLECVEKLHPDLKKVLYTLNTYIPPKEYRKIWKELSYDLKQVLYIPVTLDYTGGRRSIEQEEEHIRNNETWLADPYKSYHVWGLACDLIFRSGFEKRVLSSGLTVDLSKPEGWLLTGLPQYLEKHGLKWGGRWSTPDCAHYELIRKVPVNKSYVSSEWWKIKGIEKKYISLSDEKKASGLERIGEYIKDFKKWFTVALIAVIGVKIWQSRK